MKKNFILWISAAVITFLAGYFQSVTSSYFPVTGTFTIDGEKVSYKLDKIYRGDEAYKVFLRTDLADLNAVVKWKSENEAAWQSVQMIISDGGYSAVIPQSAPEGSLLYRVEINQADKTILLPYNENVQIKMLAGVPSSIMSVYWLTLFAGLFFAFRVALEYFNNNPKTGTYTIFAAISFFLNAVAVIPLKRTYELDAVGKKVLPIEELFYTPAIALLALWILMMIFIFRWRDAKFWSLAGGMATLVLFLLGNWQ